VDYTLLVPEPVQDDIAELELPWEIEDALYEELEKGVTIEKYDTLHRFSFGLVRVYYLDIPDLNIPGVSHFFTLWLDPGPIGQLIIRQCSYKLHEEWAHDSEAFGDDPDGSEEEFDD
jgi:hypothetical protein